MENKQIRWLYFRCSTGTQDFESQKVIIENYFKRQSISVNIDKLPKIEDFAQKRDKKLTLKNIWRKIENVPDGATIYCSELSRLGSSMTDILNFVTYCEKHDITVIQCKDGSQIENKTIGGKALIFALTLAAEIELENIRNRTRAGIKAYLDGGGKLGRANENYGNGKTDSELLENMRNGRIKAAQSKNSNFIQSEETAKFCRVLSAVIPELKAQHHNGLFYENWHKIGIKASSDDIVKIMELHRTFFPKDNLLTFAEIRRKIFNLKKSLVNYEKYNKNS